ncbi:MAG: LptA/OstA family protein, partial [Spirochaetales bacterium]|nr:LptA/OstA family protein [Spirochaetales bacterium]
MRLLAPKYAVLFSRLRIACLLVLALSMTLPLTAQTPQTAGTIGTATSQAKKKEPIQFQARSVQSVLAKGKERTVLIGSVTITMGSLTILADRVELSGDDYRDVLCVGNVKVNDADKGFSLASEKLRYDRDTETGVAQGKVFVDDTKNSTQINAEWVRFDQAESIFEAAVSVVVVKEDLSVRAEYAKFNRNTEEMELRGGVVAVTEDGTLTGDAITGKTG